MKAAPALQGVSRRAALVLPVAVPALLQVARPKPSLARVEPTVAIKPLADLPMRRLKLPKGGVGRDYLLTQITIKGTGPYDFMVDSGLTAELITPHLQQTLGITGRGTRIAGLGAGGAVAGGELVPLEGAALCCGDFPATGGEELPLPPLNAVVTPFPQEHLDPDHDPVEGMLGMEMLSLFDVDFDWPAGRLRLFKPGEGAEVAEAAGLIPIPAAVVNESGLLAIRATSPGAPSPQPFTALLDCGASFSAINWAAARLVGLPAKGDRAYQRGPQIYSLGVDGRPAPYPTHPLRLTFSGEPSKQGGALTFAPPPAGWTPWASVDAAVGDLPVFAQLLGDADGRAPFSGPAVLVGLDVLSQRRTFLCAGAPGSGRRRRLYVAGR
ncbi:hypothetical protein Rsub_01000 [Raphidocelis subcapitata]|uniref:Peptidase A2 domain-containing protein n=1 Tax=Raphidocelis subcapitata TaxID=307507 RepID=A0A2V0NLI9_9CHLO|nr:hypothetical protein Rsub_01000 [Raphidocelis subcapitata]|eukprot:GBF88288.1 hypothetical protein Rsub_01000 [Raphidocelis subcapitata]